MFRVGNNYYYPKARCWKGFKKEIKSALKHVGFCHLELRSRFSEAGTVCTKMQETRECDEP